MVGLKKDLQAFLKSKSYGVVVITAAILAYGFAITHYAIGMDDTAIALYFEEGLAPYVGRWSLFLINQIFAISDFAPWLTELLSVLILMISVTLWCVLWKRICEPKVVLKNWMYGAVAAVFLSCPLISEVFVFYLHNGVCTGYGVVALALLFFLQSVEKGRNNRQGSRSLAASALCLTVALGFYESFIIVYVMGAILCFFLIRYLYGKKAEEGTYRWGLWGWILRGVSVVGCSVALRWLILTVVKAAYHLETLSSYDVLYRSLFGSSFTSAGELAMILKRFWVKYYVNAVAYLPIAVLVGAFVLILAVSVWGGIRRKDGMLPVCGGCLIVLPIAMSVVEGLATRYRSAQYVPVVCAFGALLLWILLTSKEGCCGKLAETKGKSAGKRKCCGGLTAVAGVLLGILIYNQCADMNSWFYQDYLKYQDAKRVMLQIAYDLEQQYDTSKPIVFRGAYTVPDTIASKAYLSFGSREFGWVRKLTDPIDIHLKEKYFDQNVNAYVVAESPVISTLQWGVTAFDGTSGQLIAFWKMHGVDEFRCVTDLEVIEEAEKIRTEEAMPGYPKEGYIKELDDYIIVNFSQAK